MGVAFMQRVEIFEVEVGGNGSRSQDRNGLTCDLLNLKDSGNLWRVWSDIFRVVGCMAELICS